MDINTENIIHILEGNNLLPANNVDVNILEAAKQYHIDLQDIESPPEKTSTTSSADFVKANCSWIDLDIKLQDVVNGIFEKANYPVFIVQDDNLVYFNAFAQKILPHINTKNLGDKFLQLVNEKDWNLLAENIGEMLTQHKILTIRFNIPNNNPYTMNLCAIYVPDIEHFSFILLGEPQKTQNKQQVSSLYDEEIGLPSFFLFEDRLQMAILAASNHAKKTDIKQNIAVIGINIDNISDFKKLNLDKVIIKRLADNLVFNLPKTVTISKGLKYHFWILLNDCQNEFEYDYYIRRIKEILDMGISDNFVRHSLAYSIGMSVFPQTANSSKELIEQTVFAVRTSQEKGFNSITTYKKQ